MASDPQRGQTAARTRQQRAPRTRAVPRSASRSRTRRTAPSPRRWACPTRRSPRTSTPPPSSRCPPACARRPRPSRRARRSRRRAAPPARLRCPPAAPPPMSYAFTPPHGIPAVRLTKDAPWQDRMRTHAAGCRSASGPSPSAVRARRGRDRSGRPPRARPDPAYRRDAARRRRGRRGRRGGDVRRRARLRAGPLRADRHLHPAVDLATSPRWSTTRSRPAGRYGAAAPTTPGWPPSSGSSTTSPPRARSPWRRPTGGLAEIRRNRHPYPSWALTVGQRAAVRRRLHAGRRRRAGVRRGRAGRDARRPAGVAVRPGAGCRSSTSSWSPRCRPPRWASPSVWPHARRAGVRGDHRWAVRADPGAGAGRRRARRADRLLHHRRRPSAGGRLPHRRHRRRRARRALHRLS